MRYLTGVVKYTTEMENRNSVGLSLALLVIAL